MGAIFISYTSRDPQGPALAVLVGEWLREWGYESIFRDQDLKEGIPAASDWRRLLHGRLAQCQVLIAVCSECFEKSQWCTAEVAVAMAVASRSSPCKLVQRRCRCCCRTSRPSRSKRRS